jgi:hypothetical protein
VAKVQRTEGFLRNKIDTKSQRKIEPLLHCVFAVENNLFLWVDSGNYP